MNANLSVWNIVDGQATVGSILPISTAVYNCCFFYRSYY
jgi:hypothetical protein